LVENRLLTWLLGGTSLLVADEPGEIALGALALPHFFVDVHQTGARHEALCDLIRQHLGLKEWMIAMNSLTIS